MIKKILPAMIGAALVGGMSSAVADVTAMGHIDTAILYQSPGEGSTATEDDSTTNMKCTTCSFGFKGSEDLGNGLSAIFKIDFQYDTTTRNRVKDDEGNGAITDRDQWLGLNSNYGKLTFGTLSTVYKSHGAMLDPIYRTVIQGRDIGLQSTLHSGAGEHGEGRAERTFRYDSPTFSGFKVGAQYTLQADTATNDTNSPWGVGGQWQGGGFLVFADYITSDAGGDDDAWKVGGRYSFDKFAVFGQYEGDGGLISTLTTGDAGDPGVGDGLDTWFVGGTAGFGNNLIYAAYGQGDDSDAVVENTKYKTWNIVGVHSLSKRTKVYGGYVAVDPKEEDKIDHWTLGMKHTF